MPDYGQIGQMDQSVSKLASIFDPQVIQARQLAEAQNGIAQQQVARQAKINDILNQGAPDVGTLAQKLAQAGAPEEASKMQMVADAAQQRKDAEIARRQAMLQKGLSAALAAGGDPEQHLRPALQQLGFLTPDQIESTVAQHKAMTPEQNQRSLMIGADPSYLQREAEAARKQQDALELEKVKAGDKRTPLAKLIAERDALPAGDPRIATYNDAITKESKTARQITPVINIAGASSQFTALAHSIATGDIPAQTALSRAPVAARSQIIDMATKENPDFANAYATRKQTELQFTSAKNGSPGAVVASFNKSLSHLDTLGQLGEALKNGNTPLINKIGNYLGEQTGNPAPTNFDAAKQIVGDEVVKAIVGAGGAQADREKAQKVLDSAKTPEQLKGAIKTLQDLMIGQLKPLEQQYTTGARKNDFRDKFLSPQAKALMSSGEVSQPPQDPQMVALAKKALQPGSGADAAHIAAAKQILGIK